MPANRYTRPTASVAPAMPPLLMPQPPIAPSVPPVHVVDLMTAAGSAVFGAQWELRLGPDNRFRVFYQVNAENRAVRVLAVGVKDRSRLLVGEEEFEG